MTKIFRSAYLIFLVVTALVVGGACYQTISITRLWQDDLSMFKNYDHWGVPYFPILSPLMTILWLIVVVTGFRAKFPHKKLLYVGHFFFLVVMTSTFVFFAPFLLTHMGHPQNNISDEELISQLNFWVRWDRIRQIIGLIPLGIFIYCYGNIKVDQEGSLAMAEGRRVYDK